MTSKEFNRCVSYYVEWLEAFRCFSDKPGCNCIWKISRFLIPFGVSVSYTSSYYLTTYDLSFTDIDTIVVERYSLTRFNVDMTYFKSFVSKLSDYQLEVLKSDSRFTNILNTIYDGKN